MEVLLNRFNLIFKNSLSIVNRKNGEAEIMFNEMERKTGIAYCSLIKGMAKVIFKSSESISLILILK